MLTLFPLSRTTLIASALNSGENDRRLRFFPMAHSYRTSRAVRSVYETRGSPQGLRITRNRSSIVRPALGMDVTVATSLLLGAVFVYFSWRVMRLRAMSRSRRTALIVTAPYLLLAGLAISPATFGKFLETVGHLDSLYLAVWILFTAAASSVVVVELLRTCIPRAAAWSDRRHFEIVAAGSVLLALVQSYFIWVGRQMLSHSHTS